jgi:hypothetical protein
MLSALSALSMLAVLSDTVLSALSALSALAVVPDAVLSDAVPSVLTVPSDAVNGSENPPAPVV